MSVEPTRSHRRRLLDTVPIVFASPARWPRNGSTGTSPRLRAGRGRSARRRTRLGRGCWVRSREDASQEIELRTVLARRCVLDVEAPVDEPGERFEARRQPSDPWSLKL